MKTSGGLGGLAGLRRSLGYNTKDEEDETEEPEV